MIDRTTAVQQARSVSTGTVVFQARGITKVYRMGEVEVHALRGVRRLSA